MTDTDTEPAGTDPGVPFDSETAVEPPREPDPATLPTVKASAVKKALVRATVFVHAYAGEAVRANLVMASHEADMIAPGIARYINARPMLMSAVAVGGDEYLTMLVGTIVYGGRVWFERSAALQQQLADAEPSRSDPGVASGDQAPIVVGGTMDARL